MSPRKQVQDTVPQRPRRRWRRRLWILFLVVVLLRTVLWLATPFVVDQALAAAGLNGRYERLHLSLLAGHLELWGLELRPAGADPALRPAVALEYATVDVDMLALFTGRLQLRRVEVDGLDVHAVRSADGSIALLGTTGSAGAVPEPAPATPDEPMPPATEMDFLPPLGIQALRLQSVSLWLTDHGLAPVETRRFDLSLRLSDLRHEARPLRIELLATSEGLLDLLRIDVNGELASRTVDLTATLSMHGFKPDRIAHLLEPMAIQSTKASLDASARLDFQVDPIPAPGSAIGEANESKDRVRSLVRLHGVQLLADQQESAAVDQLAITIDPWTPTAMALERVEMAGVRAQATRLSDGRMRVAGLDFLPASGPHVGDGPETAVRLAIPRVQLVRSTVESPVLALDGQIHLPDLLESMTLEGSVDPTPGNLEIEVGLVGTGLSMGAIEGVLAESGLAPDLQAGRLEARLHAAITEATEGLSVQAAITDVRLADGDDTRLTLEQASLEGLVISPERVRLGHLLLRGLVTHVRRDAHGVMHLVAVRTLETPEPTKGRTPAGSTPGVNARTTAPGPQSGKPAGTATASASSPVPTPFHLDRLSFEALELNLEDSSITPNLRERLVLTGSIQGVKLHGPDAEATLDLRLTAADLFENGRLHGVIHTSSAPFSLRAELDAVLEAMKLEPLRGFLQPMGLEPEMGNGLLSCGLMIQLAEQAAGTTIDAAMSGLTLRDGDQTWLSFNQIMVSGLTATEAGTRIQSVQIDGPTVQVSRDGLGALRSFGVALPAVVASESAAEVPAGEGGQQGATIPPGGSQGPATAPGGSQGPGGATAPVGSQGLARGTTTGNPPVATPAPAEATAGQPQVTTTFQLDQLLWTGARIQFADALVEPATTTTLQLTAEATGLTDARDAAPGRCKVTITVPGSVPAATLDLALQLQPDDLSIQGTFESTGMTAGPLVAYLPPHVSCLWTDGRLRWVVDARTGTGASGGRRAYLRVSDLTLQDGEGPALFAVGEVLMDTPRLDPAGRQYVLQEIAVRGVELRLARPDENTLHAIGFALTTPAPEATDRKEPAPAPTVAAPAAPAARPTPDLPNVRLGGFALEISHLELATPSGPPLVGRLLLEQERPQVVLRREASDLPPLLWKLEGAFPPVLDQVAGQLSLSPFALEPHLEGEVFLHGLHGPALADLLKSFAVETTGATMAHGEAQAKLALTLRPQRRSVVDFDLSRGFGAELRLTDVALKEAPGGRVLAGVESVLVDVQRIQPRTGDVHIRQIEIVKPMGRIEQTAEGLQVGGLLLGRAHDAAESPLVERPKERPALEQPVEGPGTQQAGQVGEQAPVPELRIDDLVVSGLDFIYSDLTATPPLVVPLSDLEVEMRRFTTRAFLEPRPVRFRMTLNGGPVDLQRRRGVGNVVTGLLGFATGIGTGDTEPEARPLMEEMSLTGALTFVPHLDGWARLDLTALELGALRGAVASSGVQIGDGVLDQSIHLRFLGARGMTIDSSSRFQFLSISEPAGGPISNFLKLPAPLDQVLFLLRTPEGAHRIGLNFGVGAEGMSTTEIARVAVTTLTTLLADAVLKSPLRVGGLFTDLVGITGGAASGTVQEPVVLPFAAADASLTPEVMAQIAVLADRMSGDPTLVAILQQGFGTEDLVTVSQLANPAPAQARELTRLLRTRKQELERQSQQAAANARAHMAVGRLDLALEQQSRLGVTALHYAHTESALDRLSDLLRPGAERRRDARSRAGAIELAELRLSTIREAFAARGLGDRIDSRRPRLDEASTGEIGQVTVTLRTRPAR